MLWKEVQKSIFYVVILRGKVLNPFTPKQKSTIEISNTYITRRIRIKQIIHNNWGSSLFYHHQKLKFLHLSLRLLLGQAYYDSFSPLSKLRSTKSLLMTLSRDKLYHKFNNFSIVLFLLVMSRVVLYAIVSDTQVLQKWVCSTRSELKSFVQKIMPRLSESKSKTIRTVHLQRLWVYYFHQQAFLFILAAEGPERSVRMQNYLRVMTELFYENYDEKRFATVVDRIMNEINKIQSNQTPAEEHEGLISGSTLRSDKEKFTRMLAQRQYNQKRAYLITVFLFVCILALGIYYLLRESNP